MMTLYFHIKYTVQFYIAVLLQDWKTKMNETKNEHGVGCTKVG